MNYFKSITFVSMLLLFSACSEVEKVTEDNDSIFISPQEGREIREALDENYPLLEKTFENAVQTLEDAMARPIEIPPQGEAGGPEHSKHQQNYREMRLAGILFRITEDEKYAEFVRDMLFEYADVYPDLGPHPLAYHQAPGRIFHQMLNEAVWLVYTSVAYDCIYDWLTPEDRDYIETNVFDIMIEWFTEVNTEEFDRIHNHGTWAGAAVGMIGYVIGNQEAVDMALYGTSMDGEEYGFFRQMDLLFSPDGYYMEGPYYIRYAIQPFIYFAEAIERNQPELEIYEYRDGILEKALYSMVQTAFPNGVFPPINNASKTMDVAAPEVILANGVGYYRFGADENLLGIATIQDEIVLNGAGLMLARDHARYEEPPVADWGSVEFTDGYRGDQGGHGILRRNITEYHTGNPEQNYLLMKYGAHGGGHGHFDKLHFIYFDQNKEVIPDYGFARWINVEPKWGGRYLDEGDTYAKLTVAHNTVVVDETTQNNDNRSDAEATSGLRHFFDGSNDDIKAMSALANDHYPGIDMQRTMLMITDERLDYPAIVDLYRLDTENEHQYDYPIHYYGQPILTNLEYDAATDVMITMGDDHGYQHLWKEAEGQIDDGFQFTWLDENRYYSLTMAPYPGTSVLFGRSGANDPDFNLRSESMFMVRQHARDHLFASVIEPHGYFNEARELSFNARPSIEEVRVIGHNDTGSVIEVTGPDDMHWLIMVNNGEPSETAQHSVTFGGQTYEWTGNYHVQIN